MQKQGLRKKRTERLADRIQIRPQRGKRGEDHVAAGPAHTVEAHVLVHVCRIQGIAIRLNAKRAPAFFYSQAALSAHNP
jgi:hypothetical protein